MSLSHLGDIHLRKAEAAADEGNLERAREFYGKAIGCFEGDSIDGAKARVGVAAVYAELDMPDDALHALGEARQVLAGSDQVQLHARALNQMGVLKRRQADYDAGQALHEEARAVAAASGDLRQQAVALRNLAAIERQRGDPARAVQLLTESADLLLAEGDRRSVALIWRQVRTVELEAGRLRQSHEAVERELAARVALGEDAAIAATLFDAAAIARRVGAWTEAEAHLTRAAELRAQMQDMEGVAKALLASGALLLELGRPKAARRKLEAARDAIGEQGPVDLRAELWCAFAETDLVTMAERVHDSDPLLKTRREGLDVEVTTDSVLDEKQRIKRAREEADEALALSAQTSDAGARVSALRAVAEACAFQGDKQAAREQFRACVKAVDELREEPYELEGRYRTFLAYGTWLSRQAQGLPGEAGEASADLRAARDYLQRATLVAEDALPSGLAPVHAARARAALCAHHLRASERDAAAAQLERALAHLGPPVEAVGSPEASVRQGLDVFAKRLRGEQVGSERLLKHAAAAAKGRLAELSGDALRDAYYDLRRVQEIAKALNSEQDLDRLLSLIIDVAIDLVGAERGFLILIDEKDQVAFKVARNIERTEVERPDRKVSNTIARRAIEGGEPVITGDAAQDQRFAGALSVTEQRLRSVAAVPLRVKAAITGALYLDHRYKGEVFGPLAVELLESLADNAAIALENARLIEENERRAARLAAEKARLTSQLQSQSVEIDTIRARLREQSRADGLRYSYEQIVGRSAPMVKVFRLLDKVVESTIPVFIHGESGTGKELIARAIHYNGPRAQGPFVSENFAAIVDELLESELFGHVQGSFTGAVRDKKGLFERASGGTIFLDEVGDLSEKMQKELLRVLEEREVRPIGADEAIPVDIRLVSATHQDLKAMVAAGTFRQDLFYRLHVLAVELPPLRARRDDIPLLVERFLATYAEDHGTPPKRVDREAMRKLMAYAWPGNVRELKNFVDRTALLCKGDEIRVDDVTFDGERDPDASVDDLSLTRWSDAKEHFAARYLRAVLSRVGGNISLAARESGMLRQAFQRLLKRHNVDPDDYRARKQKS